MCQHVHILVDYSLYRRVAQCEHGTIHLSWDIATIHFGPDDLLTLEMLIERWAESGERMFSLTGWGQIACDAHGAARIWIGQAGIAVTADDLKLFCALVRDAVAVLQSAVPAKATSILQHPILLADPARASN